MKGPALQLDEKRRAVTVDGQTSVLQDKAWQVLSILREHAPAAVTRTEVIDAVWQNNVSTGEKGLNQSIWAIRNALNDDAGQPSFVRTIPRVGYQWIYATRPQHNNKIVNAINRVAGLFAIGLVATYLTQSTAVSHNKRVTESEHAVAARAYLVESDVYVELDDGCVKILRNASNKDIGIPVLSADGAEVAVPLHEPEGCRLVTIDVASGERRDFGSCPTI